MNFYKRFPGDYQRDTADLSLLEHGAFTMLLDAYYANEAPLPADDAALFRICRAFLPEEQAAVQRVVARFFRRRGGRLHNDRANRQIRADVAYSKAQSERAQARWDQEHQNDRITKSARSWRENVGKIAPAGSSTNKDLRAGASTGAHAGDMLPQPQPEQEDTVVADPAVVGSRASRANTAAGSRLPTGWTLTPDLEAEARRALAGRNGVDIAHEALKFADYWHAVPGQRGRKADWPATWRNWIRKATPTGAPHGNSAARRPSLAEETERGLQGLAAAEADRH